MARIPNDELERIKHEVSLLRLVESQGHDVTRQGKDYVVSCPFHADDTPSLIISPKSNLFHCFGCEAAGSVIDWVMKTQGVSFRHAVELLRDDLSSLTPDVLSSAPSGPAPSAMCRVDDGVAARRPPQIRTCAINASGSSTHHVRRSRGYNSRRW